MKAQKDYLYAKDRSMLHEVVPLATPYSVHIGPTSFCNFKCNYCMNSSDRKELERMGHRASNMTEETFQLLVEQLAQFPNKIKTINLAGMGEPLLHPRIVDMVAEINERNIAEKITIITNGSMLNDELSIKLIDAGLSSIKISLQGIRAEEYESIAKFKINMEKFRSNIEFLYKNKKNCKVYIKVPDIALKNIGMEYEEAKQEFFDMFGDICDVIDIEQIIPIYENVNYQKIQGIGTACSRFGIEKKEVKTCPILFYRLNVRENGNVTCCVFKLNGLSDESFNIHQRSLVDIWNSEERKRKLRKTLSAIEDEEMQACKTCNLKYDSAFDTDYLDPYAEEILKRI